MSSDFEFTEPESFSAGTIGEPGNRVFYLQVRQQGLVVAFRLEKQQVGLLGEYLGGLLDDLPAPLSSPDPSEATVDELVEPIVPEWVVGSLAVAYNEAADRFLIVAEELVPDDDDDAAPAPGGDEGQAGATARFHLTRHQVAAFVERSRSLIAAGRPLCPICGRPMDPEGHVCPRSNGHRSNGHRP